MLYITSLPSVTVPLLSLCMARYGCVFPLGAFSHWVRSPTGCVFPPLPGTLRSFTLCGHACRVCPIGGGSPGIRRLLLHGASRVSRSAPDPSAPPRDAPRGPQGSSNFFCTGRLFFPVLLQILLLPPPKGSSTESPGILSKYSKETNCSHQRPLFVSVPPSAGWTVKANPSSDD